MKNIIVKKQLSCHRISLFFENFPRWMEKETDMLTELTEAGNRSRLLQEYDDLFKGTNGAVYIPLWASSAKNNGSILLDKTTLNVIRTYKRFGYSTIDMDGNPPDFIGQMFRFLEYLYGVILHRMERSEPTREYEAAADFENRYLLDTVKAVAEGIKQNTESKLFIAAADKMLDFFDDEIEAGRTLRQQESAEECLNGCPVPLPVEEERVVRTAGRNNCGGKCVIRAVVQEGCILRVSTDDSTNHPQARACIRGRGYRKTYLDGRRLRYPMKRIGPRGEGCFQRISWDEAADITAREWKRIRDEYGPASRYVNYATGVSAALRPDALAKRLLNLDGGYLENYNTYSSACSRYVVPYIYGDSFSSNSIEDILNTKLLILWGHNPAETIFGSQLNYYLSKVKEKGTRVVVIDPRYSDTALALADEWIGIRPSTDSALADAMAYVIWQSGLQDRNFMDTFCLGFDEAHMPEGIPSQQSYEAYLFGRRDGIMKTPQWAQAVTGVPAQKIIELAREYATTKPACILPGLGPQRTGNGEQTTRSMALLACLTGNVGVSGGGAAVSGDVLDHCKPVFSALQNPFPGKIPSFLWTKAIERGPEMTGSEDGLEGVEKLETGIKMIVNLAGNTLINQHSDINNTIRILKDTEKCEFILCSDVFMTSSAKFADILLPAPSFFEDENIAVPWGGFGAYLLYQNRVIEPLFESKFEYEFLQKVAERLELKDRWEEGCKSYHDWLQRIYEDLRKKEPQLPELDVFKRDGGYYYKDTRPYVAYEKQRQGFKSAPFATPSGRIEIFSKKLYDLGKPDEIPPIPCYVPCPEGPEDSLAEKYPIQMIGWHSKGRCHSIHDQNEWMAEAEPHRLWINPADAARRGIKDGDLVEVFNNRGKTQIQALVTERIIQGVTAMAQGAWYAPAPSGMDTGGSINMLTSTRPTPLAKGNPQHTNLVEIARCSDE